MKDNFHWYHLIEFVLINFSIEIEKIFVTEIFKTKVEDSYHHEKDILLKKLKQMSKVQKNSHLRFKDNLFRSESSINLN